MNQSPARETETYYRTLRDWLSSRSAVDAVHLYKPIYAAEELHSQEPRGLEAGVDTFRSLLTVSAGEAYVAVVPGGYLCGDDVHSAVLAENRKLIWDVSYGHEKAIQDHWFLNEPELPPPSVTSEVTAALTIRPLWSQTYYHWMFEVLPRFHLLKKSGLAIDRYVIHPRRSPFQYQTLATLGIPDEQLLEPSGPFHIQARELVVPSLVPSIAPPWACSFLRATFLTKGSPRGDARLYISRAGAARSREVVNEQEVLDVLASFDFETVGLEALSVAEQAELFASAQVIVSPHGAGLTNLVFAQPGTKVVELLAPKYVHPLYWMLSERRGVDYYYLVGEGERAETWSTWPTEEGRGLDPILVDLKQLEELLGVAGL